MGCEYKIGDGVIYINKSVVNVYGKVGTIKKLLEGYNSPLCSINFYGAQTPFTAGLHNIILYSKENMLKVTLDSTVN